MFTAESKMHIVETLHASSEAIAATSRLLQPEDRFAILPKLYNGYSCVCASRSGRHARMGRVEYGRWACSAESEVEEVGDSHVG